MSPTERGRRHRARRRQQAQQQPQPVPPAEVQMVGVTSEAILAELIASRGLVSALHKAIAFKAASALVSNNPRNAEAWLALLPPITRSSSGERHSESGVRERVLQLIENHIEADRIEEAEREVTELEALRQEVAALRARLGEQPGGAPALTDQAKTITPSLGDIMPPSENANLARSSRAPVGPDDRPPPVVLDLTPEPAPPPPAPRPTVPEEWDASPSGQAFRAWRDAGGMIDYL
jgi:hypothetical protein